LTLFLGTGPDTFPRGWRKDILEEQKQAMIAVGFSEAEMEMVLGGNAGELFRR